MALNGTPPPNITTSSLNHGSYKIDDISNTKTGATISRYTDLDGHNNGLIDTQLSFNYQGFEYRRDEDERPTQPLTTTYKKIDIAAEQRFEQNNGIGANPAITRACH